ncbi:pH-response regulator protein palH/RIM21 [Neolecta irregularis DAH-3]|uniref:pH-response regulator protein palH/RIM21 n=1 Tax=Neolecta irregularis (strain DAH-3) TaxID=1198029 RepID=A0A1U7LI42_NEOID|nr:pH-response regulator protein palH/RIM21 [Neolecta irregularis DAH-3]|eukprot:OLL22325.1 pH-response regulator protein palH/RIM21 [Neolecta irregularis DAH-3]
MSSKSYLEGSGISDHGQLAALQVSTLPPPSNISSQGNNAIHEPFFASNAPLAFAVSGACVTSYILLALVLFHRRRRPWLLKIATLTVTISMTIAMILTTQEFKRQYELKSVTGKGARELITNSIFLAIFRIFSTTLLWITYIQILIRLTRRQRNKTVIKWVGIILVLFQLLFYSLDCFLDEPAWEGSVSALSKLFQIILSLCFLSYVLYYSITVASHAYKWENIPIALLAYSSIIIPIMFYCLDVWMVFFFAFGDFIRWVLMCATPILVLEWYERIEDSELHTSRNGILGRVVFEEEIGETKTRPPTKPIDFSLRSIRSALSSANFDRNILGEERKREQVQVKRLYKPFAGSQSSRDGLLSCSESVTASINTFETDVGKLGSSNK